MSEPQTHGEAETGLAEHDLPPADNGVMSDGMLFEMKNINIEIIMYNRLCFEALRQ